MKRRHGILVATMIANLALSAPAIAAGEGQVAQKQTRSMTQTQTKQRVQDGSGAQTGTMGTKNKAGNPHGPGDGTDNQGVGPKDATGYGAPGNR